jgi:hypothetical protein
VLGYLYDVQLIRRIPLDWMENRSAHQRTSGEWNIEHDCAADWGENRSAGTQSVHYLVAVSRSLINIHHSSEYKRLLTNQPTALGSSPTGTSELVCFVTIKVTFSVKPSCNSFDPLELWGSL